MRFLLDQGLPRSAAGLLRARHFDAVHAGEIGLAFAADLEILSRGREERRVIVTLRADAIKVHRLPVVRRAEE
jgi:predicted nuclease of predicted toxin-antitoxin system